MSAVSWAPPIILGEMRIQNCENHGTVTGTAGVVGGIAGLSSARVSGCTNTAAITGSGPDVAGIVAEQQNYGSVTGCTNTAAIVNSAAAYGTGGIVGWVRYNGAEAAYPKKAVVEVSGNTNRGAVSGGNDAGGIIGTVYNAAVVTGNENYAESLSGVTFAAGIVGNLQFTETPVGNIPAQQVSVTNNASTTALDRISASCKDLYAYVNEAGEHVVVKNNTGAGVAKIGNVEYKTLQDAIDSAVNGQTVTLINNVYLTETVNVKENQTIVLDLAGKAVTVQKNGEVSLYAIDNYGTFTLEDSVGTGSITARGTRNYGTMYIKGGTIDSCDSNGGGASVWNEGTLTVLGGVLKTTGERSGSNAATAINNLGMLTVENGTFDCTYHAISNSFNSKTQKGGVAVIKGGTYTVSGTDYAYAIVNNESCEMTISNAEVRSNCGAVAANTGKLTIESGSFWGRRYYGLWVTNDGTHTDVVINGGTFYGKQYGIYASVDDGGQDVSDVNIKVTGGAFSGGEAAALGERFSNNTWDLSIEGGYFSSDVSDYVAAGKVAVPGSYVVNGEIYNYKVGEPIAENVDVIGGNTVVDNPGNVDAEVVEKIAGATAAGMTETARQTAADLPEESKGTVENFNGKLPAGATDVGEGTEITTILAPRLDIVIQSYDGGSGSGERTLVLDIEAVYDIKATTSIDGTLIEWNGKTDDGSNAGEVNTVLLAEKAGTLDTAGKPVVITIPLPTDFVINGSSHLVVRHEKNGILVGYHEAEYDTVTNSLTFTNDKGFSTFTILSDARTATVSFTGADTKTYGPTDVMSQLPTVDAPDGQVFSGWRFTGVDGVYTTLTDELLTALDTQSDPITASPVFEQNPELRVAAPSSSLASGSYSGAQLIELSTATEGARIYYTTDGSDPRTSLTRRAYTRALIVNTSTVIQTYAEKDNFLPSDVAVFTYTITTSGGTTPMEPVPTYPPVIEQTKNGAVSVSPRFPVNGDRVLVTPVPDEGFMVDEVVVTDRDGKLLPVTANADGTYAFTQPNGNVTIAVTFKADGPVVPGKDDDAPCDGGIDCPSWRFADVDADAWYHEAVDYVVRNDLMLGTDSSHFAPNTSTTRAMIVTILWRMEGSPVVNYAMDFSDVATDAWYAEAVRWAAANGIVKGYDNGAFGPDDAITREQMASILYRYSQYKEYDVSAGEETDLRSYDDAFAVSAYAIPAMQWACGEGLIQGDGANLLPGGDAARCQAAAILMRFCKANAK